MSRRPRTVIQAFFAFIFFLILSAPLLIRISGVKINSITTPPAHENRVFAEINWKKLKQLPKEIENTINDTLPFRKLFLDNYISFWTNTLRSTRTGFILGKDGDLFPERKDTPSVSMYMGLLPLSNEYLENIKISYSGIQAYCDKHGIKYLLVIIPNKADIYSDHLPSWAEAKKHPSHYEQVLQTLRDTPVNLLPLRDALLEKRKLSRTYNKQFDIFHWNGTGLECAYEEISSRLGLTPPNKEKPYDIEWTARKDPPWAIESIPFINITEKENLVLRNDLVADFYDSLNIIEQLPWSKPDYTINKKDLPYNLALLSDSYIKRTHQTVFPDANGDIFPLACLVKRYFTVHYFSVNTYDQFEVLRKKIKPDFLVEVVVERALSELVLRNNDPMINFLGNKALKEEFFDLAELVKQSSKPTYSVKWLSKQDLSFLAENDDPIIELPEIVTSKTGKAIFTGELNSPDDGVCQLYFSEDDSPFNGEKCLSISLKKGRNTIIFSLKSEPDKKIRLRFDPGNIPGAYQLFPLSDAHL